MGNVITIGLICIGVFIFLGLIGLLIQFIQKTRTAITIQNARGEDVGRVQMLIAARDSNRISEWEFHEQIASIRKRQTRSRR